MAYNCIYIHAWLQLMLVGRNMSLINDWLVVTIGCQLFMHHRRGASCITAGWASCYWYLPASYG